MNICVHQKGGGRSIDHIYVNVLLVTSTSISVIERFKQQMANEFNMSDLGKLPYYLGLEVDQRGKYYDQIDSLRKEIT